MIEEELKNALSNPLLLNIDTLKLQHLSMKFSQIDKSEINFKKKINISVSSDYTTNFLIEILPLFLGNRNIDSKIYQSDYGSLTYLVRDLNNDFWKKICDIFILIPSSGKLMFLPEITDGIDKIKDNARKEAEIWLKMWSKIKKTIIQSTFDPPFYTNLGNIDGVQFGGYTHYIRLVNSILVENLPSHVNLIDIESLIIKNKEIDWQDHRLYNLAKQPFSMNTIPVLANSISSSTAGVLGMARKVIVVDLDNTIWGGIIGDDGLDGIKLGNDTPEGEAFINFQNYLKKLSSKGIILCVCSKNDHKIAQEPFIKHTDMTLKLDDITVFIANFNDKPSNIRKISEIINLGLDSFVFIDDSLVECELVKKELPEVLVINLTDDPSEFIKKIELISPFYFKNITEEDINRNISYKKISIIKNQRLESTNLEKFLKELKPEIFFEKLDKKNIERSSQLIAKTNQFKFNSNLYSSTELLEIKNKMVSIIRFKDKIQNYGIISVLIFRIDNKSKTLNIENWVMSCRVFSRQIEHYVLNYLVQKAIENQCNMIGFKFEKTKKNLYLQTFLQEIGVKLNKNEGFYHIKLNNITNKIKNYSSFY